MILNFKKIWNIFDLQESHYDSPVFHIPFTSFPLMFPPRFHWGINDKLKLYVFYQTKLGSAYLYRVKPIYWHWVVKESVRFITSAKERVCVTNAEESVQYSNPFWSCHMAPSSLLWCCWFSCFSFYPYSHPVRLLSPAKSHLLLKAILQLCDSE